MKNLKILSVLTLFLIISACGAGRPQPPLLVSTYGASNYIPWNSQNGSSQTVYYPYGIQGLTLYWDVSNINGARGVEVIMSQNQSCEVDVVANSFVGIVDNTEITNNTFMNNLYELFNGQIFEPGYYYICIKAVRANGSKTPASWPSYLTIRSY